MTNPSSPLRLEVCVDSADACVLAAEGGADRVELCADLTEGGITPSAGMIRTACRAVGIPVMVIIRPRGGDFTASPREVEAMEADIAIARAEGAHGVVIGNLTQDGEIDEAVLSRLLEAAYGMDVTFHRAFDHARDLSRSLDILMRHGVPRVLTSGGRPTVREGVDVIAALVARASGRIVVMPGGGVREDHAADIVRATGCTEIHATAFVGDRSTAFLRPEVPISKGRVPADAERSRVAPERVRALRAALSAGGA